MINYFFEIIDKDDDADDGEDDNDDDVEQTDGTHMYSIFSPRITQHLVAPEINILMEPLDANLPSYDGNLQSFDQSTARSPITGIDFEEFSFKMKSNKFKPIFISR